MISKRIQFSFLEKTGTDHPEKIWSGMVYFF